jgi:DNA-binding NarL/FixJ family response regulator
MDLATAARAARALPPQQLTVLRHLAAGLMRKEIADRMDLAPATVDMHCRLMYKNLGITNSREAVRVFLSARLK